MKKGTIIGLSVTVLAVVLGIIVFSMSISYSNQEIDLRTTTIAQQKKCKTSFDNMWKILQQKAGVADQYKDAFKEIYVPLIEGRYSKDDGLMMKWITESNPQFDASMYKEVMQSIEIERKGFKYEQDRLIDMQREHSALLQKAPSRWFLNDTLKPIAIITILSKDTKDAYVTGEENDIDLFKKETKDTANKK